jgi:hypothetical protein
MMQFQYQGADKYVYILYMFYCFSHKQRIINFINLIDYNTLTLKDQPWLSQMQLEILWARLNKIPPAYPNLSKGVYIKV